MERFEIRMRLNMLVSRRRFRPDAALRQPGLSDGFNLITRQRADA